MTVKNKPFKVGDKVIRFHRAYRIVKIKKNGSDDRRKMIYLEPFFAKENKIVHTIPLENLARSGIRRPLSRNKLNQLLLDLKNAPSSLSIDATEAKKMLTFNDIGQTFSVLGNLLKQKKNLNEGFTASKEEVINTAVDQLTEEYALVNHLSVDRAEEKIENLLNTHRKRY